ncbi:MAG TPA: hypothetical protein EYQ50_25515 [Verrucomicrobiales bacterium]|nr:hypothetical protein [Verrucomicrobiales bacterium]HIL70688.1 hypothetical protein [Verrucomicrobiota bacterium]
MQDPSHLQKVCSHFRSYLNLEELPSEKADAYQRNLDQFRGKIAACDSFESLMRGDKIEHFRAYKYHLGTATFDHKVYRAVIEANLVLKNTVQKL